MCRFRLMSMIGLLAVTLTFCLSSLLAQAQGPPPQHFGYLPLTLMSGNPTSPGPYAQILARVQQVCAATVPNQVCYVNGQITLEPLTSSIPFNQPGDIADLAHVQRLSLASAGSDPQMWSLAWLRLTADSGVPAQELTILAFGNVEIWNILPLSAQPPLDDEMVLPSLQFASQPVDGVIQAGSSGLIVTNSTEDEVLSLMLNGAVITLASDALVEAQPGSLMNVTMASGVSNIEAAGQSNIAVQGHQVTLPLNHSGRVSGPPAKAVALDPQLDLAFRDLLLMPLLSEKAWQKLVEPILPRLDRIIDRCLAGQANYVYNLLFWTHVIERDDEIKSRLDPVKLAQAYNRAPQCLTFEVDFDSSLTTQGPPIQFSHLHTQGLRLQFGPTGNFRSGDNQMLVYQTYQYNAPSGKCTITTSTTDGLLEPVSGRLSVAGNRVQIYSEILVVQQPTDAAVLHCPPPVGSVVLVQNHWWMFFPHMHEDLMDPMRRSFHFRDWHYTGGEHFGETIYVRHEIVEDFTLDTTTYLIMIHTPQQ